MTHSVTLLITTNHQTIADSERHMQAKKSYSSIQNGEFCYGSVKSFRVARAAQGAPVRQHHHLLLLPRLLLPPQFMQVEKTDYRQLQVWKLEKGELKPACTNYLRWILRFWFIHILHPKKKVNIVHIIVQLFFFIASCLNPSHLMTINKNKVNAQTVYMVYMEPFLMGDIL